MTGADMDSVICSGCGTLNEVAAGTRPACNVCGVSLRLGTLVPPPGENEAGATAAHLHDGGGIPAAEPEDCGEPGSRSGGAREPCRCDSGGPRADDPTICFRCGGLLPISSVPDDEKPTARQPAGAASQRPAADATASAAPCCTLVLADGHRVRVGSGILISGESSYDTHPGVLCVDSRTVSRKHAWLREDGGKVAVVDLGSTNGTWIEGSRIGAFRAVEVGSGARVHISFGRSVRAALEFSSIGEIRE